MRKTVSFGKSSTFNNSLRKLLEIQKSVKKEVRQTTKVNVQIIFANDEFPFLLKDQKVEMYNSGGILVHPLLDQICGIGINLENHSVAIYSHGTQ